MNEIFRDYETAMMNAINEPSDDNIERVRERLFVMFHRITDHAEMLRHLNRMYTAGTLHVCA